ncbi:MAG: outer membrane beta-barrel protein [Pseudomonadota bacterium]
MRFLALSISALALGACSVGGGYSWEGGGFGSAHSAYSGHSAYGNYGGDYGYASGYPAVGQPCGATFDPCAVQTHAVQTPVVYTPPPVYTPPVVAPAPCGYAVPDCAPPAPPVYTPPCQIDPCTGTYPVSHAAYAPDPHAYGTHAQGYGVHGASYGHDYGYGPVGRAYGTLGAVLYDVEDSAVGAQARLGYRFTPGLAAEVEGSIGLVDDKAEFGRPDGLGGTDAVEQRNGVDHSFAAFAVGHFPLTPGFSATSRFGYHVTETSFREDVNGVTVTDVSNSTDGIAYGFGAELAMTPSDALRFDYTRYETDGPTQDSLALSYLRRF